MNFNTIRKASTAKSLVSMLGRFGKGVGYTFSAVSGVYCTLRYVCGVGKCEDVSMEPVIQGGDLVLLTPYTVSSNKLNKGDVVFCRSPKTMGSVICKRVMGLEGDFVHNMDTGSREYVSKGQVWLEGDNKDASVDSRNFGQVPYGLLISKVALRMWPPSRIGFLTAYKEEDYTDIDTESS